MAPAFRCWVNYSQWLAGMIVCTMLLVVPAPVHGQTPNVFGLDRTYDRLTECFEILGFYIFAVNLNYPAESAQKIREAFEARSQAMQTAINNIKGDYLLAQDFGELSAYESTYLDAATQESDKLQGQLAEIRKQIDCWKHLEKLLRLVKLDRKPSPPIIENPGKKPKLPEGLNPRHLNLYTVLFVLAEDYPYQSAKTIFDALVKQLAEVAARVALNKKTIEAELEKRGIQVAGQPGDAVETGNKKKGSITSLQPIYSPPDDLTDPPPSTSIAIGGDGGDADNIGTRARGLDSVAIGNDADAGTYQPEIKTTQAQTTVSVPDSATLLLGGAKFFVGGSLRLGTDSDFSSNPGNQSIDIDGKTGFGVRGGAVLPLGPKVAVGAGVKYDQITNDTVRLNNANGTFVNTTGDGDIDSLVAEIMAYFKFPFNVTGRISGYYGQADRDINLNIGGVSALRISDRVTVTGYGVGLGVPATNFGIPLPNVCFNGGIDVMHYGSASGVFNNVPFRLGSYDQVYAKIGATISFGQESPQLNGDDPAAWSYNRRGIICQ